MALFRKTERIEYDPQTQEPVIQKSICTGEMTAGLVDRKTGRFTALMRLDGPKEQAAFCRAVGRDSVRIIY